MDSDPLTVAYRLLLLLIHWTQVRQTNGRRSGAIIERGKWDILLLRLIDLNVFANSEVNLGSN